MKTSKTVETLGEVLINVGVITEDQLKQAYNETNGEERDLSGTLIKLGFVTESQIIKAVGVKSQIPYFDKLQGLVTKESARIISEELSRKYQIVALFKKKDTIVVAMVNPYDIYAIDDIASSTGLKVEPVISTRKAIFSAISTIYKQESDSRFEQEVEEAQSDMDSSTNYSALKVVDYSDESDQSINEKDQKAPIIRITDRIIVDGIEKKVSDIHIEPKMENLSVRYRMDGMLHTVMSVPRNLAPAVTSRIKVMAKLDISETRRPQDGRIQIKLHDRMVDLRVSIIPTISGEKTVIRILDKEAMILDFKSIGFPEDILEEYKKVVQKPNGIVLVTGPTGSGKTTTLYTTLRFIMDNTKNISTLEDPVEYQFDGINQIQVNSKIGLTFADGLRSLLRQDPDVLLVGEIRDLETANIAIQAALTGHMVFATLHTNDACGAVSRLIDMEVEPFLLNTALVGVAAQRLLRTFCPHCKEEYKPDKHILDELGIDSKNNTYTFFKPVGCKKCFKTGYAGRTSIVELLPLSKEVKDKILMNSGHDDMLEAAKKSGFQSMYEQAVKKVLKGETSVEEVFRVTRGE